MNFQGTAQKGIKCKEFQMASNLSNGPDFEGPL